MRKFRSGSSGMLGSLTWSDGLVDQAPGGGAIRGANPAGFIPCTERLT